MCNEISGSATTMHNPGTLRKASAIAGKETEARGTGAGHRANQEIADDLALSKPRDLTDLELSVQTTHQAIGHKGDTK